MSFKYSWVQESSLPGAEGMPLAHLLESGMTTIIVLAFPAAIRLSRMKFAYPPRRGSVIVQSPSFPPPR